MTQVEILEELKKLTTEERLAIAEAAIALIREEFQKKSQESDTDVKKHQLSMAAESLLADYINDSELTIFKVLDGEDFHA